MASAAATEAPVVPASSATPAEPTAPVTSEATPAAGATTAPAETTNAGGQSAQMLLTLDDQATPTTGDPAAPAADGDLEIVLPEGTQIDAPMLDAFRGAAKEAGLNGEAASKIASWYVAEQAKAIEAQAAQWEQRGSKWAGEIQQDPDFGGEKLAASVQAAKRALRKYGGQPAADAIAEMGLGNHPELFRLLARVGLADGEDNSAAGGTVPPAAQDKQATLMAMYPSMFNADGSRK